MLRNWADTSFRFEHVDDGSSSPNDAAQMVGATIQK
jgi:hypothetical protein